ncbi:hypothetical protein Plim_0209 [Planctopirus limnophila DSM 3776]|uniref:Uncharacterized protein n=1 Tax=Planctopirus limnophila (strain ATCC 43296 / DSM 3776 / IFAM 1008 / Mu 290) TaxID=521674 RepID=D5SND4_PLAL2|nr:hypothetical protein [Planctopirus limnophila]ADG66061.1 hypothetical protein Plim_0209 [Planctopirus limnophila DSM 3776]
MTPQILPHRSNRSYAATERIQTIRLQFNRKSAVEQIVSKLGCGRLISGRLIASGLILCVVLMSGCAKNPRDSIAKLWDHVPSAPWTAGKSAERKIEQEQPTVAANSAATLSARDAQAADAPVEDPFEVAITPGQSTKSVDKVGSGSGLPEGQHSAIHQTSMTTGSGSTDSSTTSDSEAPAVAKTTGAKLKDALPDPLSATPGDWTKAFELANGLEKAKEATSQEVSRIGQLRETLEEDAQAVTKRSLSELNEFRLRIESLLSHARRQIEAGELKTAQRFARLANELSEGAGLEYSPTEERPQDLLHRIEDLIALSRPEAGELKLNDMATDQKTAESAPDAITSSTQPSTGAALESEKSGDISEEMAAVPPALQGSVSANRALRAIPKDSPSDFVAEASIPSDAVVTAHVVQHDVPEATLQPLYLPGVEQLGTEIRTRGEHVQSVAASKTETLPEVRGHDDKQPARSKLNVDAIGEFEQLVVKSDSAELASSQSRSNQLMTWVPWVLGILVALGAGWGLARSTGRSVEVVVSSHSASAGHISSSETSGSASRESAPSER